MILALLLFCLKLFNLLLLPYSYPALHEITAIVMICSRYETSTFTHGLRFAKMIQNLRNRSVGNGVLAIYPTV